MADRAQLLLDARAMKRAGTLVVAMLCSACATLTTTTTMAESRRAAMSTIPAAPQALSAGSGVGVGARTLFSRPRAEYDSGLAFGLVQMEGGGLFRLGNTLLGGSFAVAPSSIGSRYSTDSFRFPENFFAVTSTFSIGHEFLVHRHFGFMVATDVGLSFVPVREESVVTFDVVTMMPVLVGGLSVFGEFEHVRPYFGATVGTGPMSDAVGVQTVTCSGACRSPDSASTTATTSTGVLAMLAGGVSVRPVSGLQVNLEVLIPLTEMGAKIPVSGGVSLRISDL